MRRMKARIIAGLSFVLVACSSGGLVTIPDETARPDAGDGLDASDVDGSVTSGHDAGEAQEDASTADGFTEEAGELADSATGDASDSSIAEAGNDSGVDGGADAGTFDAGSDAGTDAGPPPPPDVCPTLHCNYPSAPRCDGVIGEDCSPKGANAYACWTPNDDQSCCTQPGRWKAVAQPGYILDSTTARTWSSGVAIGPAGALGNVCDVGARMPTTAELKTLLIGVGTCTPSVDQVAIKMGANPPGELLASDGCVDMTAGAAEGACVGAKVVLICTLKP